MGNLNPYIYTYQNPIIYIDPNGKQVKVTVSFSGGEGTHYSKSDINAFNYRASMLEKNNGFVNINNIDTGRSFVNSLILQTKKNGSISGLVTFAHSGATGIFANNDEGFYTSNNKKKGDYSNVDILAHQMNSGNIKFSKDAVWVFGSCFTANSADIRLNSPSDALAEYTASTLNITTVGATGSVYPEIENGKETGRLKIDGTFKMFSPLPNQITGKKQVKETDLGKTINPTKLVK